jgi:hypothetical protein
MGGADGNALLKMTLAEFDKTAAPILQKLAKDKATAGSRPVRKTEELSVWLRDFAMEAKGTSLGGGGGLEVPGQYTGDNPPQKEAHVQIAGFSAEVKVLSSLMLPKLLVIHGDDGQVNQNALLV